MTAPVSVAPAVPIPQWTSPPKDPLEESLRQLILSEDFAACTTLHAQVVLIHERFPDVSSYRISKLLGVLQNRIDNQFFRINRGIGTNGRPPFLTDAILDRIDLMVNEATKDRVPLRVSDIAHYLAESESLDISQNTLRKALKRCQRWQVLDLAPIEHDRQMVSEDAITEYKRRLKQTIDRQPAAFVFNCDESGFDSFCDARHVSCLIPAGEDPRMWNFPVKRNEKRITLLGCISAAGTALRPLCITSRKTIDSDVLTAGYTQDRVAYAYSPTGYITEELFRTWVERVFVPHIEHLRAETGLYTQQAFLILDNCTSHKSPAIEELFHRHGIVDLPLIPHSSHRTQQLDIGIFGNVKQAQSRIHPSSQMSTQSQQLLRMLGAWVQITHPMAVTSAFERSGIRIVQDGPGLITLVDEERPKPTRVDVTAGLWPEWEGVSFFQADTPDGDERTPFVWAGPNGMAAVEEEEHLAVMAAMYGAADEVSSDDDSSYGEDDEGTPMVTRRGRKAQGSEPDDESAWCHWAVPRVWTEWKEFWEKLPQPRWV